MLELLQYSIFKSAQAVYNQQYGHGTIHVATQAGGGELGDRGRVDSAVGPDRMGQASMDCPFEPGVVSEERGTAE